MNRLHMKVFCLKQITVTLELNIKDVRLNKDLIPMAVTLIVSLVTDMAYGFLAGLIVYHLIQLVFRKKGLL